MCFYDFHFLPLTTENDGWLSDMQMALRQNTIYHHWNLLFKQEHEIFNILGPEVSTKTMIDRFNFLTNLQSKIWKFHENWLKRFWENVSGKKRW